MKKEFARLGVSAEICVTDATAFREEWVGAFDRVLADVPCTGLGFAYRKADVKYNKSEAEFAEIVNTQGMILKNASRYVAPGGRLVYSTCTVRPAENQIQIDKFLNRNRDFVRERDDRQFFAHRDGVDGFYIAVLRRMG